MEINKASECVREGERERRSCAWRSTRRASVCVRAYVHVCVRARVGACVHVRVCVCVCVCAFGALLRVGSAEVFFSSPRPPFLIRQPVFPRLSALAVCVSLYDYMERHTRFIQQSGFNSTEPCGVGHRRVRIAP